MKYKCAECGKMHEGWPAIAYITPHYYDILSDEDKELYVKELNDDFCVIEHEDQTDYFIRAILLLEVKGNCQPLNYGIWVSLSASSFEDYNEHFFTEDYDATYFGYISSNIPGYNNILHTKANVVYTGGRQRPEVIPHDNQTDNDFTLDYYNGITIKEAEKRINAAKGGGFWSKMKKRFS